MAYRFLGKWDRSPDGESPSVWVDEHSGDVILQGWKIEDPAARRELLHAAGTSTVPENEELIRFPADLLGVAMGVVRDRAGGESG